MNSSDREVLRTLNGIHSLAWRKHRQKQSSEALELCADAVAEFKQIISHYGAMQQIPSSVLGNQFSLYVLYGLLILHRGVVEGMAGMKERYPYIQRCFDNAEKVWQTLPASESSRRQGAYAWLWMLRGYAAGHASQTSTAEGALITAFASIPDGNLADTARHWIARAQAWCLNPSAGQDPQFPEAPPSPPYDWSLELDEKELVERRRPLQQTSQALSGEKRLLIGKRFLDMDTKKSSINAASVAIIRNKRGWEKFFERSNIEEARAICELPSAVLVFLPADAVWSEEVSWLGYQSYLFPASSSDQLPEALPFEIAHCIRGGQDIKQLSVLDSKIDGVVLILIPANGDDEKYGFKALSDWGPSQTQRCCASWDIHRSMVQVVVLLGA